ncbi:MAG: hypothetical protein AB7F86_06180 [Bdellovibrionales bacterium]
MADLIERFRLLETRDHWPSAVALVGGDPETRLSLALKLIQVGVCESNDKPCGQCGPCRRIEKRESESLILVEPDGASIRLEAAHAVQHALGLRSLARRRFVLVVEAGTLNPQASNSLLKIVEEPPPGTHFFFLLSSMELLLPTLRSRVQVERLPHGPRRNPDLDEELGVQVLQFLNRSFAGERSGLGELLGEIKDRATAIEATQWLQILLRDWTVEGAASPLALRFAEMRSSSWPDWSPADRQSLWGLSLRMEQDLSHNVDRQLVFENFFSHTAFNVSP